MDPNIILIAIGSFILFVALYYLDHLRWIRKTKGLRGELTQFLRSSDLTGDKTQDAETLIWKLNSFFPWVRKGAVNEVVKNDALGVKTIFTALDLPYYKSWIKYFVITQDEFTDVFSNFIVNIHPVLVSGLATIGKSSVEKLKDGLQHSNLNVRLSVIEALGRTGDSAAAEFLIPILDLDSSEIDERIGAIIAVGELRAKSATEKVMNALKDENPVVRDWAVHSLIKINDIRALPALELVRSDNTVIEVHTSRTLGDLADWAITEIGKNNSK